MAKIALIVGSVRRDRQGIKVARWIEQKLKIRNHMVFFIDPLELNLPLLDRMYKEMTDPSEKMLFTEQSAYHFLISKQLGSRYLCRVVQMAFTLPNLTKMPINRA